MLLLGIDLGTSSIKVAVVDAATQRRVASAQFPEEEVAINSPMPGWAEQSPETWWVHIKSAILKLNSQGNFDPADIAAIGISYQMHGLVLVDKEQHVLRDSIIWCDSRAVEIGDRAFEKIGQERCFEKLLNSPGNFTASKLAWVKAHEPLVYKSTSKLMLPGDFVAMKLTGEISTTPSGLSEGIFWDFRTEELSGDVMSYFDFDSHLVPEIKNVFALHGNLSAKLAKELGLKPGTPVSYKAGDQLNNALSLNVMEPGEVAATAGTSGVVYAVTEKLFADPFSRVNAFAHVNHTSQSRRLGVLLCINGTGIMNKWVKNLCGDNYHQVNQAAAGVAPGSEGLMILPFGNGAERIFKNKIVGAQVLNIDLNKHSKAHVFRAVQEGIAFAFRYGLDIMRDNQVKPSVIRVGNANMFLSEVFIEAFVNATNLPIELYDQDGSTGAAIGAGIGAGIYSSPKDAFTNFKPLRRFDPSMLASRYDELYKNWKDQLQKFL